MDLTGLLALFLNLAISAVAIVFVVGAIATVREKMGRKSAPPQSGLDQPSGLPAFETRGEQCALEPGGDLIAIDIQGRGGFPETSAQKIAFLVSLFDRTTDVAQPVLSAVDDFADADAPLPVFKFQGKALLSDQGNGFAEWTRIVLLVPELLVTPARGERNLEVIIRIVDADNPPKMTMGVVSPNDPGLIATYSQRFAWTMEQQGYAETARGDRSIPA